MLLGEDYIVTKFYQYAGYPKYNRISKIYTGGCPTCREGKSWGKKRRLYYVVKNNLIFCHNCGLSMKPIKWISTLSGLTYADILKENRNFTGSNIIEEIDNRPQPPKNAENLPIDAINLLDKTQTDYYKDSIFVQSAIDLLSKRRLECAINKPQTFWISLVDKVHKNRLVIPFYDCNNKIIHYQTRTVIEPKRGYIPKYLSKQNSEKSLFGINNVKENNKTLYITEGPLDACFLINGIAVAGINEGRGKMFTPKQEEQLKTFLGFDIVWVLDNQRLDSTSKKKTSFLLKQDQKVFIWPKELKRFKDVNDVCMYYKINKIPESFIQKNIYSGLKGTMILSQLN